MLTPRELYDLELAHAKAQEEDRRQRTLNRLNVEAHWPATIAWIDHIYEQEMSA